MARGGTTQTRTRTLSGVILETAVDPASVAQTLLSEVDRNEVRFTQKVSAPRLELVLIAQAPFRAATAGSGEPPPEALHPGVGRALWALNRRF